MRQGFRRWLTIVRRDLIIEKTERTRPTQIRWGGSGPLGSLSRRTQSMRYPEGPARSKTPSMYGVSKRENREISTSPDADGAVGTRRKGQGCKPPTNDEGKSHRPIVPTKPPNKVATSATAAEVEGRGLTKENASKRNTHRTQSRTRVPSELAGVREAARRNKGEKFTALLHHITAERLRKAYLKLNQQAAAGIDEVTWEQYRKNLEENVQGLHRRLHQGAYRAQPSRRAFIAKTDGQKRPLGIAALEDKIVQRAVVEVLSAIYEELEAVSTKDRAAK